MPPAESWFPSPPRASVVFDEVQPVIGPYDEPPLACRDFDPRAAEIARQVGSGSFRAICLPYEPEHVGSTAVPGCGGRGIVDLLIACPEGDAETASLLLGRLGFRQGGEALFPPHPPAYQGAWVHDGDTFLLHVHVLPAWRGRGRFDALFSEPVCGPTRNSPGPMSSTSGRSFPAASPRRPNIAAKRPLFSSWFWANAIGRRVG